MFDSKAKSVIGFLIVGALLALCFWGLSLYNPGVYEFIKLLS